MSPPGRAVKQGSSRPGSQATRPSPQALPQQHTHVTAGVGQAVTLSHTDRILQITAAMNHPTRKEQLRMAWKTVKVIPGWMEKQHEVKDRPESSRGHWWFKFILLNPRGCWMLCRIFLCTIVLLWVPPEIPSANVNVYIMGLIFIFYSIVNIKSDCNEDKTLDSKIKSGLKCFIWEWEQGNRGTTNFFCLFREA